MPVEIDARRPGPEVLRDPSREAGKVVRGRLDDASLTCLRVDHDVGAGVRHAGGSFDGGAIDIARPQKSKNALRSGIAADDTCIGNRAAKPRQRHRRIHALAPDKHRWVGCALLAVRPQARELDIEDEIEAVAPDAQNPAPHAASPR